MGYLDALLPEHEQRVLGRTPFVSREQKIERFLIGGMITEGPWRDAYDNLLKAGIDHNALLRLLLRLAVMESRKEEPKRLRNLQDMLRRAQGLNKTLLRQFGLEFKEAFDSLKSLCQKINLELKEWPTKAGKGRGVGPQTPLIVAMVTYAQKRSGHLHCKDIAALISLAYKAAGRGKKCQPESLLRLFSRNRALQKDWQSLMGFKPNLKVHAPGRRLLSGLSPRRRRAFLAQIKAPKTLPKQTNKPKQNTYIQ